MNKSLNKKWICEGFFTRLAKVNRQKKFQPAENK
jgi:hypothetical protein